MPPDPLGGALLVGLQLYHNLALPLPKTRILEEIIKV